MSITTKALLYSVLLGGLPGYLFAAGPELSAVASVEEYCKLDLRGARLQTKTYQQIAKLTDWEEESGWDLTVVTETFAIKSNQVGGDGASVSVEYSNYGKLDGSDFRANRSKEIVTFKLRKVNNVWKITSPMIPPHVSPKTLVPHVERLISAEGTRSQRTWSPALKELKSLETGGR